jgi:surface-adhesin protein E
MNAPFARIALIAFSLTIGSAWAENWVMITKSLKGTHYVDADSIQQHGAFRRAWTRLDYTQIQIDSGTRYKYELTNVAFDCSRRRVALTAGTHRDTTYQDVESYSFKPAEWEFMQTAPGTVAGMQIKFVCGHALPHARNQFLSWPARISTQSESIPSH